MKLLLHICCAPCSIHPYRELRFTDFDTITGFFYNPNIHPYLEYNQRRTALENYSKKAGLDVIYHRYDIENFFRRVSNNENPPERCRICWRMRLEEAANFGKANGFNAFTTTLLISPYQDQKAVREIGDDIAKTAGIDFLYKDFRDGFRTSQEEARSAGLYRQKYCGCIFSEREKYNNS